MLVTLVPLVFALLHISGVLHLQVLERLDHIIYDARLRAFMPRTQDDRIVIVDIDEKSLEQLGHWPWGRDKLAALTRELFERDYLIAQINRFGGNISRTAEFVGMERSALHRKLKTLGV